MRRVAFLLGMWLITMAMPAGRAVPSRKANDTKNRFNADFAAHWTQTNTNTTGITTNATNLTNMGSRLGGNGQQSYLGTIVQAGAPGLQAHSGVGTLGAAPTAAEFNSLNTAYNNLCDAFNELVGRLQAGNILT